jgi:segregation and condensation protein B
MASAGSDEGAEADVEGASSAEVGALSAASDASAQALDSAAGHEAQPAETPGGEAEGQPALVASAALVTSAAPLALDGPSPDTAATAEDRERTSAEVSDEELEREVAALLFASPEPLSEAKLAALLDGTPQVRVRLVLDALARRLSASGLPWELRVIAGGWQLYTVEALADTVGRLSKVRKDEKVSPAGLETLAIVAYRQPVTKGEIEAIRGVQVGPILRTLVDRGLVKVAGRSDDPGRPLLYGTTKKFLDSFGLGSLDDLPRDGELLRD